MINALNGLQPLLKWFFNQISPTAGKVLASFGIIGGLGHFFAPHMNLERPPLEMAYLFAFMVFVGTIAGFRATHRVCDTKHKE